MELKALIYINTLPVHNKSGGIKTFLLEMLQALAESDNNSFRYCLVCSNSNKELFNYLNNYSKFSKMIVPVNNRNIFSRIFFEQFRLNNYLQKNKNTVLLNICNVAILKCSVPQVTIIQAALSIASLRKSLPSKYVSITLLHKLYYDLLVLSSINISKKTVAVSYHIKNFLGKNKEKVEVIHEGVNISKFKEAEDFEIALPDKYILMVNTLFPYKNIDKAIIAFSLLKKKNFEHKLVIAGKDPDGKQLSILKNVAKEYAAENDVIFLGMIPHNKIFSLYKKASLFILLSSIESFGLPILEAMVARVPVIASDKTAIPEIANNAAILVDPFNVNVVATQMENVLSSENLQQELIIKGTENVDSFGWDKTAGKFEKLFLALNN